MVSERVLAVALACAVAAGVAVACSQGTDAAPATDAAVPVDATAADAQAGGPGQGDATTADGGTVDAAVPTCITPATAQSCAPPSGTTLPLCKLSQTGCMAAGDLTRFAAAAVPYEVNSPLWSDGASKTRAFVLPPGGTIHVKDCAPDAGAAKLADCVSPSGIPNGAADTGKWVFPVGTVMIKNFSYDGKLVETRLLMRVDAATAALIQNGTDWVGYNYAWNAEQTEATVVPGVRTAVNFDTGTRSVAWHYPSFIDCVGCHTAATGTLGPETAQMNRDVDGGNQIDAFKAKGLFDGTAPAKPYAAALADPTATGPTLDRRARSYLSANCGFCHRPDVNDQGFDLRHATSLHDTGICNLMQQNGIPGMPDAMLADFAPGDHAASAMWIRMNTPPAANDPSGNEDVGRMPPVASFAVDTQAVTLVGQWIDSVKTCPGADAGP